VRHIDTRWVIGQAKLARRERTHADARCAQGLFCSFAVHRSRSFPLIRLDFEIALAPANCKRGAPVMCIRCPCGKKCMEISIALLALSAQGRDFFAKIFSITEISWHSGVESAQIEVVYLY
jgi:hypothetical protein